MVSLHTLCSYIDEHLQSAAFSDYGVNGLQVQGRSNIKSIGTAVSANLETIKSACGSGVEALIVHHGLFWSGDNPVIAGSKREKLQLLLKHDVSLLAYHLPLDAHQQLGNNWKAAQDLGWTGLEPFGMFKGIPIGVKGHISPTTRTKFQKQLEHYYNHPAACAFGGKETVKTVALISGGAYKSLSEAAAAGIDCFITGNFDEPAWNQAFEEKINFYALGHTATERIGPKALGEHLQQHFGIQHHFLDTANPF